MTWQLRNQATKQPSNQATTATIATTATTAATSTTAKKETETQTKRPKSFQNRATIGPKIHQKFKKIRSWRAPGGVLEGSWGCLGGSWGGLGGLLGGSGGHLGPKSQHDLYKLVRGYAGDPPRTPKLRPKIDQKSIKNL